MTNPTSHLIEERAEEAINILHDVIPHTVLELEDTAQTDYDRGYIFYQDLVVGAVKDNESKLRELIATVAQEARKSENRRVKLLTVEYFEKGFGFTKGSINDSIFQDLKEGYLKSLSHTDDKTQTL